MSDTLYKEPARHDYLRWKIDDPYQLSVVRVIVNRMGLASGDKVIEVGAGAGRYTSLLRRLGLRVLATEPDETLCTELRQRFQTDAGVSAIRVDASALPAEEAGVSAVCGFHVLHHLDSPQITGLANILHAARQRIAGFRGWFFVEPNPLNPLYAIQITAHPAMRWSEEYRIWTNNYAKLFAAVGLRFETLGGVGLLPPQLTSRLPSKVLAMLRPRMRPTWLAPLALYRVYGAVSL